MSIYKQINEFLKDETKTAADLIEFANKLVAEQPENRRFVQEWVLEMITNQRFSKGLFSDSKNMWFRGFCLYPIVN